MTRTVYPIYKYMGVSIYLSIYLSVYLSVINKLVCYIYK